MEESGPIQRARMRFQEFVLGFDTSMMIDEQDFRHLGTWLEAWLLHGDGFEYTGRNHETYLRVALDVADAAMRNEIKWNYAGTQANRREDAYKRQGIVALHDPSGISPSYADRANYEVMLFQWEEAHHRE